MRNPLNLLLLALTAGYGLWRAIVQQWTCDDAFISFRYARNLVDGHGLVFNLGEHVEGYTNFLWTMVIALGLWAGIDAVAFSRFLGIGFFLATVVLLWRADKKAVLPLAAVGLALHHHSALMASFGLETAMFTFLVTVALVTLVQAQRPWQYLMVGTSLVLASMTRPDGLLLYSLATCFVALQAWLTRQPRMLLAVLLPGICLLGPYGYWKLEYYQNLLPNTFYAKSASKPYLSQGLLYLWLYFKYYAVFLLALLVPLFCLLQRRKQQWIAAGWDSLRAPLVLLMFIVPYLAYVVWVGGDFMFSRFCLPVTPALFMGLQLMLPHLGAKKNVIALAGLVLLSLLSQFTLINRPGMDFGEGVQVFEERRHYPELYRELQQGVGEHLAKRLQGESPVFAISGGQAMFAYYCNWPTVIEMHGLTDSYIANRKIKGRFRVGHEKLLSVTDPYLRQRSVNFMFMPPYFQERWDIPGDSLGELRDVKFLVQGNLGGQSEEGWALFTMLTYNRAMMDGLKGSDDVQFQPFDLYLDGYIRGMGEKSKAQVAKDYAAFKDYYFDHNQDLPRQQAFTDYLR